MFCFVSFPHACVCRALKHHILQWQEVPPRGRPQQVSRQSPVSCRQKSRASPGLQSLDKPHLQHNPFKLLSSSASGPPLANTEPTTQHCSGNSNAQGSMQHCRGKQPSANRQSDPYIPPHMRPQQGNALIHGQQPLPAPQALEPSQLIHGCTSSNPQPPQSLRQHISSATNKRPAPKQTFQSSQQRESNAKMLDYTVQLVPDLSSIQLADGKHAAFQGRHPPSHHNYTAIHAFLEYICTGIGGAFVDVWLDTAHITFADVQLPSHQVQKFAGAFSQATAELPPLTGCYNITDLKLHRKDNRRDSHIKGDSFYYLDLNSTSSQFQDTQQLWARALQKTVCNLGGRCDDIRGNQEQHMTIRSFSLRTAAGSFHQVAKAVRANPARMRCAGIRIQQSVSQALEAGNGQGLTAYGYCHLLLARYPVPLYTSCEAASHGIVLADKERRLRRKEAALREATVNDVLCLCLDRLSMSA